MRPALGVQLPGGLDIARVNDPIVGSFGDGPDFDRAMADCDPRAGDFAACPIPPIVQAHNAARHGVDVQLPGHPHGGQLRPFHYGVKVAQQPVVSGLGQVDGMPVYVTNGAGFWGPPVRVGAPPDTPWCNCAGLTDPLCSRMTLGRRS